MKLTPDAKRSEIPLVLAVMLLAACNLGQSGQTGSGPSRTGDEGTGSGPCKNIAICTLIPQSEVNTKLGVMASNAIPDEPISMGGMTADGCSYLNAAAHTNIQLKRICNTELVPASYEQLRQEYLARDGTRADLSGVGEKGFYETVPGQSADKVRLVAFKGNVYVILSDEHVASGQEAMVKQGLISFAQTLLTAK